MRSRDLPDTFERAITIDQWEELQLAITEENELCVLSSEERKALEERLEEIDRRATHEALDELIQRHRVEFTLLLNEKRNGICNAEETPLDFFLNNLFDKT